MNIYLAIKYHPNARNRPLVDAIDSAVTTAGHSTLCVARDLEAWGAKSFPPDELMRHAFQLIDAADLVLVELSEKGVGLGIEAGYAHAQGTPIVVVAQRGSDISTTLRGIAETILFYDSPADLAHLSLTSIHTPARRSTWDYIVSSVNRLVACLDGLDAAALNWRPLPAGNSLYVLATHMIGNIEETVWGVICGHPVQRNREAEFQASGAELATIQMHWTTLRDQITDALQRMSAADLARVQRHPRRGAMSAQEILVVVARHAAEHLAQAELTRELLGN